mmetsp:Transcript_4753/g.12076  ORF Transcript_4753/g.12076 Transcript_4753/m.12076 type:complete len:124 (-) Transcript_4753:716-1087(-)
MRTACTSERKGRRPASVRVVSEQCISSHYSVCLRQRQRHTHWFIKNECLVRLVSYSDSSISAKRRVVFFSLHVSSESIKTFYDNVTSAPTRPTNPTKTPTNKPISSNPGVNRIISFDVISQSS